MGAAGSNQTEQQDSTVARSPDTLPAEQGCWCQQVVQGCIQDIIGGLQQCQPAVQQVEIIITAELPCHSPSDSSWVCQVLTISLAGGSLSQTWPSLLLSSRAVSAGICTTTSRTIYDKNLTGTTACAAVSCLPGAPLHQQQLRSRCKRNALCPYAIKCMHAHLGSWKMTCAAAGVHDAAAGGRSACISGPSRCKKKLSTGH